MKNSLVFLLVFLFPTGLLATSCNKWPLMLQPACKRLKQISVEGENELYLSGYAWHNRYTYSAQKIKTFNENAWGGGFGKGLYDEKGNWHGLYAFAFMDSHNCLEPLAGYAYLEVFPVNQNLNLGLGLTVFLTARRDIFNNIPFPGALPWLSINYRQLSLGATYIPGAVGAGNVLFLIAKYRFANL